LSPQANLCPHCGQPLRRRERVIFVVKIIMAASLLVLALWFLCSTWGEMQEGVNGPVHVTVVPGK